MRSARVDGSSEIEGHVVFRTIHVIIYRKTDTVILIIII